MRLPAVPERLLRMLAWRDSSDRDLSQIQAAEEQPLRAELFSVDQLERHAKALAASHQLAQGRSADLLLPRLNDNERVLFATYDLVTAAAAQNRRIEPAAEWLLDNFYLIEEQIRSVKRLFSSAYSRELPRLAAGSGAGLPRVYGIALELIAHVDGRVDTASLNGFITAYQSVEPLKLGELWALPLMLRLALIENLRRVSTRIAAARRDRDIADDWAERMVTVVERSPTDLILVLADMARANPPLSGAFLSELTRHLQGQNPNFAFANSWLEHRLADQGLTTELLVRAEGQSQAADQVSIGNSINTLRFLSTNDWRRFVSEQSLVEHTLAEDPVDVYAKMDFATRDRYRHAVEGIARRSRFSEYEVARRAVQLAQQQATGDGSDRAGHVGFYLVDRGRSLLERQVGMRLSLGVVVEKFRRRFPLLCYLTAIGALTLLATGLFFQWSWHLGAPGFALMLLTLPVLMCAAHLSVAVANWLATMLLSPQSLPRMEFAAGIPPECRTLVAIPTMLSSAATCEHLLEDLEVRYLSSRDKCLHFALVTDFPDATAESMPTDAELLRQARAGIEQLNQKYASDQIFFLLHRPRRWNAQEGVWMGYERKRGKLSDLNALLRGDSRGFSAKIGDTSVLSDVQYVITLDTDTQLPRDAARQMVGTLAHTLNRPVFDPKSQRVVDGYTILQPRVGISLPSAQRTRFVQLCSGDPGIDPYTRVVSDVYQDLFGEGSFIGKGIYQVDTFEKCCRDFPENTILSHDLLEGANCRSALLSDVTLFEDHPARYTADVGRRHRWMRGDWQIASWLLPWVKGCDGQRVRNPISALSWWKIFDNLRRSLVPVAMVALLLVGWFVSLPLAQAATLGLVIVVCLPWLLSVLTELAGKPVDLPLLAHLRSVGRSSLKPLGQCLLTLLVLPYEAYVSLDAVSRTLVRMAWTKRRLLEWTTASDSERRAAGSLAQTFVAMAAGPVVAGATCFLLGLLNPAVLLVAAPWLFLWLLSPAIAWWLSQPIAEPGIRLSPLQFAFLSTLSRRTWRYFEEFVSAEHNWLPPDNIQENREEVVAPRTSPTNIGMSLLANLAAHDFGYCSTSELLDRTQKTLTTLACMERYRGHFFNWYDTRTLLPLNPRYVSTVDSGNLAANLIVLANGYLELNEATILQARLYGGVRDTLRVLLEVARGDDRQGPNHRTPLLPGDLVRKLEQQLEYLATEPHSLHSAAILLERLASAAKEIVAACGNHDELAWWAEAYEAVCVGQRRDLLLIAAWLELPSPPSKIWEHTKPAVSERLNALRLRVKWLDAGPSIAEVAGLQQSMIPLVVEVLAGLQTSDADPHSQTAVAWIHELHAALLRSSSLATQWMKAFAAVEQHCRELAEMDYEFLYDPSRELFSIGYNVNEHRLDASCYDLLASEARVTSYLAVAQGQVDQEHWFALGRLLTSAGTNPALLSWSGSMFEYLMPLLIMPSYENTLLDRTYRAVVRRQIEYGKQRGIPWGISESGYNAIDLHKVYQYRAFGVPGLGLKRGLAEDLVIAPYASVLALMVDPRSACKNLQRLTAEGQQGPYGLYEAVDYTPSRLPPGARSVTVRQFMAHHEGMSLLALSWLLLDQPMQRRFESDLMLRAADLLLHERIPKAVAPVYPHASEANTTRSASLEETGGMRVFTDPSSAVPELHLLSNGSYHVVVTSAGGGYNRWRDFAVTRWREDVTRDGHGSFCYLRDLENGALWSTAWQPTAKPAKTYEAIFTEARAEFRRRDGQIETYTQISVSPEDDIELRRVTLTNVSQSPRRIEITSYAEVVLASQSHDEAHPAFSNLFVQTELASSRPAIYCTRRPRSAEEHPPWMMHMMTAHCPTQGAPSFETDRARFVGRDRSLAQPAAFDDRSPLSNTAGSVLDPIVSVRQIVLLQPNEAVRIDIVTGVAETRAGVEAMAQKYSDPNLTDRVFDLAWTHSHILLQQLSASEADAQAYGRLAGSIVFASSLRRAKASVLAKNRRGQSGLWGYGISGDLPIVLVRIRDHDNIALVRQAVQAHAYWRMKGLAVDLVIWNEDDSVYRQTLQESIMDVVAASPEAAQVDRPGGIFIRRGEQMSDEDRALLQTVARVVLLDDAGSLSEQVEKRGRTDLSIPLFRPSRRPSEPLPPEAAPKRDLAFFNGLGGFSRDGREYVTILTPGQSTPAPWVNVIANSQFGTVISCSGSAYTWAENSHEFRLTPWHNDPVSDTCGEALYLRDEETGRFWSPTPQPAPGQNHYVVRHGFGYTIFDYREDGIETELCVYVATDAPVKICKLKITNRSARPRQISVAGYWELVLGDIRAKSLMHVVTEIDPVSGALFARNVYSPEFADRIMFVDSSETIRSVSGDRTEFIGRNGSLASPAVMRRARLSGRVGAGFDPCAAILCPLTLEAGQERTVSFVIGSARGESETRKLVQRFRSVDSAHRAITEVWDYWSRTLGVVHVETPDPAVNFLTNGWLVYQTLACRMWARSGFYQSGGAFGFRDQLQDAMALIHAEPRLLREHLLRAASRQFREGDVQHWWHPPVGRGVRTHFSDDYLWLPLAICRYVGITGDVGVLEERVPYLDSRPLRPDEEANYDLPQISDDVGSLYDHGVRALDHGLRFGVHGLPLMGCGDWNDGMNLVGQHGQGESVWLAFFLYQVLGQFAALARQRGDAALADRYTVECGRLRGNIEEHAWDGQWYRRAYFDDGTPLGSQANPECQIDSISQSWSILSGAGTIERSELAMRNVENRLVSRDARLIKLLDPPFDKSDLNPGYIKGYVPGVRENGGQYTHSAIWTVMATAALGDNTRAWELFRMINPLSHGATPAAISTYRVEPYVVAADVYAVAPHTGRGGWTWYTGSAGWMYRLITESLLGLHLEIDKLRFAPCLPDDWSHFKIHYRYRETFYHISVQRDDDRGCEVGQIVVDGISQGDGAIALVDDRRDHQVEIHLVNAKLAVREAATHS